jgi:AAA domain
VIFARVLRLPGSVNRKLDQTTSQPLPPVPCRVIETSSEVITWDSVEEILTAAEAAHPDDFARLDVPVNPPGEPISAGNGSEEKIRYGHGALDDELEKLGATQEGHRNIQLNESGFKMGQLVPGGYVNFTEAYSALAAKGAEIGLGAGEIQAALNSGMATGQQHARTPELHGSNGNLKIFEFETEAELDAWVALGSDFKSLPRTEDTSEFDKNPDYTQTDLETREEGMPHTGDWDDRDLEDTQGAEEPFDSTLESTFENAPEGTSEAEAHLEAIRQRFPRLDWYALWTDEETPEEYIHNPLLPIRRGVAIFSPPKAGKTLLLQEMAVTLSRGEEFLGHQPTRRYRVLYVDFENDPRGDVRSRLQAMNYGPDDLDYLDYLSYPSMAALDSYQGGYDLLTAVTAYGSEVVVIDTVSRVVAGEENSNGTWLKFYQYTGLGLKQLGVSMIRLYTAPLPEPKILTDPVERLVWFATVAQPAQPWLPTPSQQDEVWLGLFGDRLKRIRAGQWPVGQAV